MELLQCESLSSQIAGLLEQRIVNGELRPDSKLRSSRELASEFKVDRMVIRSAMDILAKKRLIVKRARKGVYVSSVALSPEKIEAYVFSFGGPIYQQSYVEQALNLTGPQSFRNKFSLTIRCISRKDSYGDKFIYELERIRNSFIDIVLTDTSALDEDRLAAMQDLPFPILVVGEFPWIRKNKFKVHQVYQNIEENAEWAVDYLKKSPFKDIVYFCYPKGEYEYEDRFYETFVNGMQASGKQLTVVYYDSRIPLNNKIFSNRQEEAFRRMLDSGLRPDLIYSPNVVDVPSCQAISSEYGIKMPEQMNIISAMGINQQTVSGCLYINSDFSDFSDAVFNMVQEIVKNPEPCRCVDLPGLIRRSVMIK